ncbi:MAG: aldo/keto reductase [Candidatus Thiodiazotropha taylori]|nr:aldo/keto reductase [Candidatus Thiodiazotropha taylori]MCW4244666.1 aldo/keto reductase [Candidatus Thiodiazotropha taylori]
MIKSALGNNGPLLPRLGYGAMVLEGFYGEAKHSGALSTLHHAMDQGIMIDTADAYGDGHNERLIGEVVQARKDDPFIATKFGIVFDPEQPSREIKTGWGFSLNINASPEYAQKALDDSLQRLGVDTIDLWYMHYPDPSVPIEESVGAMADAVKQGKVRYLGLSNVTADQIRKASAIHPINAVQYEYSLWRREAESELLPTLRDLGIALVGWSPLGSGFLTGNLQKLDSSDFRNTNPKMRGENFDSNKARVEQINQIAARLKLTTAQVSLAWLLAQGDDIFPIPGTRKTSRIDENLLAASVDLTPDVIEEIDRLTSPGTFAGGTLLD